MLPGLDRHPHARAVLRVDTMNDEAANRMLKTLEEPPAFAHLVLLTDRPGNVMPTIASRCQHVRFDAPPANELAALLQERGVSAETARACARLSLGDGEKALALALGGDPSLGLGDRLLAGPLGLGHELGPRAVA